MNRFAPAAAILAAALLLAPLAHAKTFRWASQGDILTMDPHSQNEALNNGVLADVYETLVTRDKQLKVVPLLAVSWTQPKPTVWRFVLRKDVKFHDGTPFTAEDVVFSIQRAQAPSSNFQIYTQGIDKVRKIDDYTVEIETKGPNPVLLDQLTELRVMSKAWAEKNKVTAPQNFIQKEETYSARNANGTGPYMLKSRETDVRTVFVVNPNWWGKREGNVTEVIYTPVKADATRVAALLSGELDFVLDPPPQDIARLKSNPNLRILEGNENRTIFLGMDQHRDELLYSDVKGKNPFKDKRVRQAIYHAIDEDAIQKNVMRGLALPTGSIVAPQVRGYSKELDKRLAHDKEKAKKLLAEAGYPNGFEVTLDCPNNRYINDERICQAVAGMLAQVGIRVKLNAMPRATYFPKIQKFDTSDPEVRHQHVPARLGRADLRRAVLAAKPRAHRRPGRRRQLQPRPLLEPADGRARRAHQDRNRSGGPRPHHRRGARDPQPGRRARAAASPGDPLGDESERRCGASRRQPRHHELGDGQVAATRRAPSRCSHSSSAGSCRPRS